MPTDSLISGQTHVIRAEHAATSEALFPLTARLENAPPGWRIAVHDGDVVVSALLERTPLPTDTDFAALALRKPKPAPAPQPTVIVTVADPLTAAWIDPVEATIPLAATSAIVQAFPPKPMTLTIELVTPTGAASSGRTVEARGTAGAVIPLTAVTGEPGTYRSPRQVWTKAFHPLELRVGGVLVTRLTLDFHRADTRVRAVDPT